MREIPKHNLGDTVRSVGPIAKIVGMHYGKSGRVIYVLDKVLAPGDEFYEEEVECCEEVLDKQGKEI